VKEFTDGETYEAVKAMEANVQGGTGTGAALGCPTAGKTGTTDNSTDAWFGGFTSSLNTTVWVGYPNANLSMGGMSGGQAPASIFRDFMVVAMNGRPCKEFPEPKEPFVGVDFSGFYFTQGAPGESVDNEEEKKEKKDKKKSGGNNGGRFPDNQYEGNPQPAPRPPRPAPRPEPAPEPAPPTDPDSGGVTPE
jgi:penicillin-binding protein 1A